MIGPNGAGKSTLLSLVARLLPLQSGSVTVDGLKIGEVANDILAKNLAILSQSNVIAPRLTIEQLISFGRYPHSQGRLRDDCRAMIEQAIARFELGHLRHRMLDTLSGGQRQRALVAMTYAQDTDYLLLDEPLNNLDISASRSLMQLVRQMVDQNGKTAVVVLHDINYACAYADQIVVLTDGRLIAQGSPQTVITEALLAQAFDTDAQVGTHNGRPVVFA